VCSGGLEHTNKPVLAGGLGASPGSGAVVMFSGGALPWQALKGPEPKPVPAVA
jgi:hypothetical protein